MARTKQKAQFTVSLVCYPIIHTPYQGCHIFFKGQTSCNFSSFIFLVFDHKLSLFLALICLTSSHLSSISSLCLSVCLSPLSLSLSNPLLIFFVVLILFSNFTCFSLISLSSCHTFSSLSHTFL